MEIAKCVIGKSECTCKPSEDETQQQEEESDYVVRCCGNCSCSGELVYILMIIVAIPTSLVLFLAGITFILAGLILRCCASHSSVPDRSISREVPEHIDTI